MFRVRAKRTWAGVAAGIAVGIPIGSYALTTFGGLFGLSMLGCALLGAYAGGQRRGSSCSAPRCSAPLELDAIRCTGCGGTIVGEIDRAKDHLAALEAYERHGLPEDSDSAGAKHD